jgi:AcrR family transcriptional regulator
LRTPQTLLEDHVARSSARNTAGSRHQRSAIVLLYQYFPGKDALTVALINREHRRFYEDAAVARTRCSGRAALETLLAAAVRQQLQRPMLARLLDLQMRVDISRVRRWRPPEVAPPDR